MLQREGCPPGGRGLGQSLSCRVRKGQAGSECGNRRSGTKGLSTQGLTEGGLGS